MMVGKIGNRFMEFAFGVILARLLVPADFGIIVTIHVFTGFVGMLASGGMGQSLVRAKTADENDFTAVFTMQLAIGVLVYACFFMASPWIAGYFGNPLYTDLIRVSALAFLLRPFAFMRGSWLNREMNFKNRSIVDVATGFLTGITSTLMAWAGLGVWSLTLSGLLGAATRNMMLARITPLKLRLNFDLATMRKHSAYGFMITANDFVTYLSKEGKNLLLSKLAGPAFLGLFNKAESTSRLPNQLMVPATMEPVFRAMSKVQDDLDQTKYMFYRTITLLMVYTTPIYVLLWWIAEPFISVVYGEKWLQAGAPMSILATAGVFLNVVYPCGVVLAAQNRLKQEMAAQSINLLIMLSACYIGLEWGLEGVAWGIVLSNALLSAHFYWLVYKTLPTRAGDLLRAVTPGLILSGLLFAVLALTDAALGSLRTGSPFLYLMTMSGIGGLSYTAAFLYIPFPALKSESSRWRQKLQGGVNIIMKAIP
jgi:O-antigen/teichoic acid export membrane protein